MKLFVFSEVKFPKNYHRGGGAVIVAQDENRLREILDQMAATLAADDYTDAAYDCFELTPGGVGLVYEVLGDPAERIFRFPDKGCC